METVAPIGDPMSVIAYSHRTATEAIKKTTAAMLMSVSLNPREQCNFVQWFEELGKGPGGTVRWPLITQINGPGVIGLAEVTGQEVPLRWTEDEMVINRDRMPVIFDSFSQQMVPFSLRDSTKTTIANWLKQQLAWGVGNQLGGNTAQTNIAYTGMNPPIAPDANHWIFGGNATTEAALVSNTFKLTIDKLDQIVAMAQTGLSQPIKPVSVKGIEVLGILFVNGFQLRDLQAEFGQHSWGQIYLAAMQGGQVTGNPINN